MISAAIAFVQGASSSLPGVSLIGVANALVTATNGNDAGVQEWRWELVDASALSTLVPGVLQDSAVAPLRFTPDASGGYLFHLTVFDQFGNFAEDFRVFQVPETSGRIIPPFRATDKSLNFVIGGVMNLRGWSPFMEAYLRHIDASGSGTPAYTNLTAGFTQPSVSSNVTIAVANTSWMTPTEVIYIAGGGYYQVISIGSSTAATVENLGYTGNASPTASVPSGGLVTPGGLKGVDGANGTNGGNAYTTTTGFTQPAVSGTVTVPMGSTAWLVAGQTVYVATGGYYSVSSITDGTHAVLQNLGYTGNAAPTTTIGSGSGVSPGGIQGPTGSAGTAGWTSVLDLDFTVQTTQTIGTDGNVTIAGLTWTKGNSTNDQTAMQLTNGTGVTITPKSAADMAGGSSNTTAPFLWISLSSIFAAASGSPTFDWQTRLRVHLSIGSDNEAANFDFVAVAISTLPVPGTGIKLGYIEYFGHSSAANVAQLANFINNTRNNLTNFKSGSNKTILLSLDHLSCYVIGSYDSAALSAGASFPAASAYKATGRQGAIADITAGAAAVTDLGLLLCAGRAGSATAYAPVVQRVKVEYA